MFLHPLVRMANPQSFVEESESVQSELLLDGQGEVSLSLCNVHIMLVSIDVKCKGEYAGTTMVKI